MRKDFTPSERVAIAEAIREAIPERRGRKKIIQVSKNGDKSPTFNGRTREPVAKQAGFSSGKEYERAKSVVEKGTPELVAAMDRGEVKVSAAAKVATLPKSQQKAAVNGGAIALKQAAKKADVNRLKSLALGASERPGDWCIGDCMHDHVAANLVPHS